MITWIFAAAITAIACAALYFAAAGRRADSGIGGREATQGHFRLQLKEIEADLVTGRLGPDEGLAAKSELAREVLRAEGEAVAVPPGALPGWVVVVPLLALIALAGGTYAYLGSPNLPARPLASRNPATETEINVPATVQTFEMRVTVNPDDLSGWKGLTILYAGLGRTADALHAVRRVSELEPSAENDRALGEALIGANGNVVTAEALGAFRSAVSRDANDVLARIDLAASETQMGDFAPAIADWNAALALAKGDEPWVEAVKEGLAFAQVGLHPDAATSAPAADTQMPDAARIDAMVTGLEQRLLSTGGAIDEWTQLVRSRLVQGKTAEAQADYLAAIRAYPDAAIRAELDALASANGLSAGATP